MRRASLLRLAVEPCPGPSRPQALTVVGDRAAAPTNGWDRALLTAADCLHPRRAIAHCCDGCPRARTC